MGMADKYIKAIDELGRFVEEMFDKMADHCEFTDKLSDDPDISDCLYYGRPAKHICDREICPILEGVYDDHINT